jgi:OmcA/MtrC family decaheme c-type cytochrome
MRIPKPVFARGRYVVALGLIAGSVAFLGAERKAIFPRGDRANVANPQLVAWVQPGLLYKVVSATIASDGTVSVDFKTTDPNGAALDATGVVTPGTISTSFLLASIPKGQAQFVSYITRTATAATGGATATQATGESSTTGTLSTVAMGEYLYTFKTKVPANDDPTATHRVGLYGSRNLTQFTLGTNYASVTFDWVPNGATPAPRDVVRTSDCNSCHDLLAFHGGSRQGVDLCIMCHTPQTTDPNTGNTLDMKVFIHKIHMGASLPSVVAGGKYQIDNYQNAPVDFSTVVFPSNPGDPRNCAGSCHNPKNGAAQTNSWMIQPSQAACGSCHDNVNFATGANHGGVIQADDTQCTTCHIPSSGQEFDLSITGAHANPTESISAPGINLAITKVANGVAGKAPTVSFTITDNSGNGISMATMTGGENRLALVLAGTTSDYGTANLGTPATPGYVSENPVPTAQCDSSGNCTYTFTTVIPATATGTYAIGIEGRRGLTLPNAPTAEQSTEYGAINKVFYFSVDGTPVVPRRTVVAIANCDKCHTKLSLHGENRNQIEMCVLCHNSNATDASTRPSAVVASDKTLPNQGINFAMMVHKIHTGETMGAAGLTYIIVGYGGSHNDFSTVLYPAMTPSGGVADTAKCYMCHVNTSEGVFPIGKNAVADPQGLLNPAPATTSACTACHFDTNSLAHAISNTDPKFGEACDVCHATGATYDVDVVHAGK